MIQRVNGENLKRERERTKERGEICYVREGKGKVRERER